jgi:hypothetical protein
MENKSNRFFFEADVFRWQYRKRVRETKRLHGARERDDNHDTRQLASRYRDCGSHAALLVARAHREVNDKHVALAYRAHNA